MAEAGVGDAHDRCGDATARRTSLPLEAVMLAGLWAEDVFGRVNDRSPSSMS